MSKFSVGDKVISVKNIGVAQEGRIGYVTSIVKTAMYPIYVIDPKGEVIAFSEDELELLSVSTKEKIQSIKDEARVVFDNLVEKEEHTGSSVDYYKVHVSNPTTLEQPYYAEANDIIESLGLTFAEGNLLKAVWRIAADRNGKKKKGNNSVYDAEKLVFFAERVLAQEKSKR